MFERNLSQEFGANLKSWKIKVALKHINSINFLNKQYKGMHSFMLTRLYADDDQNVMTDNSKVKHRTNIVN